MTEIDVTFEHEDTFTAAATTGNVRLGQLESLYEELFADVIADGIITARRARAPRQDGRQPRPRSRSAARRLEQALQAAYEARHHVVIRDLADEAPAAPRRSPRSSRRPIRGRSRSSGASRSSRRRIIDLEQRARGGAGRRSRRGRSLRRLGALRARAVPRRRSDDPAELERRLRHDPRDDDSPPRPFPPLCTRAGDVDRALFTAQALDAIGAGERRESARFAAKHRQEGLIRPDARP